MNDIINFKDGLAEALSVALWLAKRTPLRLWHRLPGWIDLRIRGLVTLAREQAKVDGLLAGLAFAVDCVRRLRGLRACEELSAAISTL